MSVHKFGHEVARGDTVVREDGRTSRVVSIEKGWIAGSLFFGYRGDDWSCVATNDLIEIKRLRGVG